MAYSGRLLSLLQLFEFRFAQSERWHGKVIPQLPVRERPHDRLKHWLQGRLVSVAAGLVTVEDIASALDRSKTRRAAY